MTTLITAAEETTLARARKIFATARMLGFSLGQTKKPCFADVLLRLTPLTILLQRHPQRRNSESRDMMTCRVLLLLSDLQSFRASELYGFSWLDPRSLH